MRVFISQLVNLSLFAFTDIGKVFFVCECRFVDEVEKWLPQSVF